MALYASSDSDLHLDENANLRNQRSSGGSGSSQGFFASYTKPLVLIASIATIIGIIMIIVFGLLPHMKTTEIEKYPFTLASVFNTSLSPKSFSLIWDTTGDSYIYKDPITGDWYRYSFVGNESALLVNVTQLRQAIPNYSSFSFSPDGAYLLVAYNVSQVWRHSVIASYIIYSVTDKTTHSLVAGDPQLQNVVWNPDNYHVAYVHNDNIYIVDASNPQATPVNVTSDGNSAQGILNGIQSWVYEEEIFSDSNAMWWSDDGHYLAYLRFDESQVPIFEYSIYTKSAYPTQIPLRYPKAGYTNPSVSLRVFDAVSSSSLASPDIEYGASSLWEYVASVQWRPDSTLWVQQLNRYQNFSSVAVISLQNGNWTSEQALTQSSDKWVEIFPLYFYQDYTLMILPHNGYFHIANLVSTQPGTWQPSFWTGGNFDIIQIYGFGADGNLYYLSTPPVDSANPVAATLQHIYHFNVAANQTNQVGSGNGVYTANFSPLGKYFVMRYLGPDIPQVFLVSTTDFTNNVTLEDNKIYAEIITHYDFPKKEFTTVTGEANDVLNAYYKTPYEATPKRPLIINVYAGPNTQNVRQTHDVAGLDAYLATQGYMVAAVDGRGTGRRGLNFLQQTYRQLGLLELADQRAGAKELASSLTLVNSKRVGIWGWSYGGFMAAHAIAGTSSIDGFSFKAAVSVAPVTSWEFYDSVYTERYMSTPADNPAGYNQTSVLVHAGNTPSDSLLLMHGTGDDNVHFQNTVELVNALIKSDVQFQTMFFPNDNHAINTDNDRRYLYEKMINFFDANL